MKYRKTLGLALFLILTLILVGPWPVLEENHFEEQSYAQTTFGRIDALAPRPEPGPLRAGVATADITPPLGVPLAGYSARDPKANSGAMDRLSVKALTLDNGHDNVTILSGDYLLPMPGLVQAVLEHTGLSRDQVFFTATHTHSGPGGFAKGLVAEGAMGEYRPEYLQGLALPMAEAITRSRARLSPVTLEAWQVALDAADHLVNSRFDTAGDDTLNVLQVRTPMGESLATLVNFSAHATYLGKKNRQASADYPGVLQRLLETRLGGLVMFTAGAVGGTKAGGSEVPPGEDVVAVQKAQMEAMAAKLANRVVEIVSPDARNGELQVVGHWRADAAPIAHAALDVELPSPVYHLSEDWRLSPYLVNWLFHGRSTTVDALAVGKLALVGYPADFSDELGKRLETWARRRGTLAWVTGFNGDYIGYVMPKARYATPNYTTRDANAYGPWAGEYLTEVGKRLIERLQPAQP